MRKRFLILGWMSCLLPAYTQQAMEAPARVLATRSIKARQQRPISSLAQQHHPPHPRGGGKTTSRAKPGSRAVAWLPQLPHSLKGRWAIASFLLTILWLSWAFLKPDQAQGTPLFLLCLYLGGFKWGTRAIFTGRVIGDGAIAYFLCWLLYRALVRLIKPRKRKYRRKAAAMLRQAFSYAWLLLLLYICLGGKYKRISKCKDATGCYLEMYEPVIYSYIKGNDPFLEACYHYMTIVLAEGFLYSMLIEAGIRAWPIAATLFSSEGGSAKGEEEEREEEGSAY